MDNPKLVKKTVNKTESPTIDEVTDDSLEKINGGVQPRPKDICKYCGGESWHTEYCPYNPKNNVHL